MQLLEIFILIVGLLTKHFLADYVLQSRYIIENKRHYGHPGGLLHAGFHAVGSAIAFLFAGVSIGASLITLLLAEFIAHYHIDWAKDRLNRKWGLTPDQRQYWALNGFDQFLHHLTYVIMIAIWLRIS